MNKQKIQISLIWMEENSYYIFTWSLNKDIAEIERSVGGTKGIKLGNESASPSPLLFTKEAVQ
jgi:hypothetical protein